MFGVLSVDGQPLMSMKDSCARRFLKEGKAKVFHNDLCLFQIQLWQPSEGEQVQDISLGIDPGKLYSGIGVQASKATLFRAHLQLPFKNVTKKMIARRILRRARRGRRINRKLPFELRCHKQKCFDNRRQKKLPPSIRVNRDLELRVVRELSAIFPVAAIYEEIVKADVRTKRKSAQSGKGFSPVMVGQKWIVEQLTKIAPTFTRQGWQKNGNGTSQLRKYLGLFNNKKDKSKATPETHAVDGVTLACSHFVQFKPFHTSNTHGHQWKGSVEVTNSPFAVIARPNWFRRQLHFENPDSKKLNPTQYRKRKGGTITPYGFRSGDYVEASKPGSTYRGWIGGFTHAKTKNVSIYNLNWKMQKPKMFQFTILTGSGLDNFLLTKLSELNELLGC